MAKKKKLKKQEKFYLNDEANVENYEGGSIEEETKIHAAEINVEASNNNGSTASFGETVLGLLQLYGMATGGRSACQVISDFFEPKKN